jgi:hypothetical protein
MWWKHCFPAKCNQNISVNFRVRKNISYFKILINLRTYITYCDVFAVTGACSMFAGFLTPTRRVSWYPRRVIKGRPFFADYSLFTYTALTTDTTLITTIPHGTYILRAGISCPMAAVLLSLLWTNSFTCSVVCTGDFSALSAFLH